MGKLDRLGRDLRHLIQLIDKLNERNIRLKVVAGSGAQIDTTTANGLMMFGLFAVLAEFGREMMVERRQAGLAAAIGRGRLGGRPRKIDIATIMMARAAINSPIDVAQTDLTLAIVKMYLIIQRKKVR